MARGTVSLWPDSTRHDQLVYVSFVGAAMGTDLETLAWASKSVNSSCVTSCVFSDQVVFIVKQYAEQFRKFSPKTMDTAYWAEELTLLWYLYCS